ncbi:PREDICTED: uncharacterized protein LOC107344438 [Acropora digitifera]|uniref:uncharacterized protein LOC107344438 n=1 Tax=Acropora digitifera TaxID=70779 RepID=UPI00077A52F0|nr:PREDICTED: uncharacterized protein LOC107344438 [Acropora digitifera]
MMSQDVVSEEADAVQISQGQILNITLLASEWKSSAGGLSTLNRELAIHLAQIQNVRVSLLVPEGACSDEDKREAESFGISILDAKKCVGVERLLWLGNPPQDHKIDVILGHGVKLGCQVQFIKEHTQFQNCMWVHVVHTAPEDLSKYKGYSRPISRGEGKHWEEVHLCKCADLVVPVGPRLGKAYPSYLQECKKDEDFFELIPGLFEREFGDLPAKQKPKDESDDFIVLLCGRGDKEDFEVKGYDIAVKAFADQRLKGKDYFLLFVGSPEGKQDEVRERLLKYGITDEQLTVREFVKSRERMKELFCEVDMVIMPSKSEGFGLVALEGLSAGLPVLVGRNSGFARAIKNIPLGQCSIVGDSGDPARWAEAIEDVRDRHGVVLEENGILKKHYNKKYCWKTQCEELVDRLRRMVYRMSTNKDIKIQRSEHQLCSASPETSYEPHYVQKSETNGDKKALGDKNKQYVEKVGGNLLKCFFHAPELEEEKQSAFYELLAKEVQTHAKFQDHSTDKLKGVGKLTVAMLTNYGLLFEDFEMSSLIIIFKCQSLKSLELLWSDYLSGHLDKMAEWYLVTDEVKEKLNLETIRVKATIEEENYLNCRKVLVECSGTSAAQPILPEDSMNQGPLAIPVSPPDPTTVQQQFKEQASTSDSKNPKKLGKRGISETTAEHGTSAAQPIVPEDSVCPLDPTTVQQQFKEGETTIGNKSPKKLGKRGISESSAEHDLDTHETVKVQRLEEQLHRVTPEAFYEPGSVLKLEVKEEEKVLATSEDEQHLRDFGAAQGANNLFVLIGFEIVSQDEVCQEASAVQISQGQILNITLLASEWKSSAGGLSTLNRELAIHLAQIQNVRVSLLVPEGACDNEDKREARSFGISILDAKKCIGLDSLFWLSNPPQNHKIDVIVGHGVKLGCQVQLIKRQAQFQNCKWVHVVHTAAEDLSKYKAYSNPNSKGEEKHWDEVDLCKSADLVVPVGPKLQKTYHGYLQSNKKSEDFFELIPGLFEHEFGDLVAKQKPKDEKDDFMVLLCGRGDKEDFEVKGYDIAVKAFADQRLKGKRYSLLFVGSPEGKQDEVGERLLNCGIDKKQLTVREFVKSREKMKDLFCEVNMVIMPSKSEGFGLVALEALSAGLPILVGSNSGFARAIEDVPFGSYCIIDSDDPAEWAKAIQRIRGKHRVILKETKMLRESYGNEYCWKTECEELVDRLWKMVYGTSGAQAIAADDLVEQCHSAGSESVCEPDTTMQFSTLRKVQLP